MIKTAEGVNSNPFYQTEDIPAPLISPKATIEQPALKKTVVYDFQTRRGKSYELIL